MNVLAACKTTQIPFLIHRPTRTPLFSVRAYVSARDALEQASMLLDLTRYAVDGLVDGYTERAVLSAVHLIEFAKALVDACQEVCLEKGYD
jgi:hypothetical protein